MGLDAPSVLTTVYLSRRDAILRFLSARLGNREDAEDVLQDLFMRLDRAEATADLRDPAAFVYKMALNLARDKRRQVGRSRARDAQWSESHSELAGGEAIVDAPSAETAYEAKQRLAAVEKALGELSPQCRRAFMLHKFEGLSHEEVSARAGITRSTVEKHMNTALRHLIKSLGRD